jgi:hypothetical protein
MDHRSDILTFASARWTTAALDGENFGGPGGSPLTLREALV